MWQYHIIVTACEKWPGQLPVGANYERLKSKGITHHEPGMTLFCVLGENIWVQRTNSKGMYDPNELFHHNRVRYNFFHWFSGLKHDFSREYFFIITYFT